MNQNYYVNPGFGLKKFSSTAAGFFFNFFNCARTSDSLEGSVVAVLLASSLSLSLLSLSERCTEEERDDLEEEREVLVDLEEEVLEDAHREKGEQHSCFPSWAWTCLLYTSDAADE